MATITVDLAAITATAPEIARAGVRSTSPTFLANVINARIKDLNKSLQDYWDICDGTNQTAIAAIQAKLLP